MSRVNLALLECGAKKIIAIAIYVPSQAVKCFGWRMWTSSEHFWNLDFFIYEEIQIIHYWSYVAHLSLSDLSAD